LLNTHELEAPYTYKKLMNKLRLHHRAEPWFLGVIKEYCRKNKLPLIQALVANKRTKLLGTVCHDSKRTRASQTK